MAVHSTLSYKKYFIEAPKGITRVGIKAHQVEKKYGIDANALIGFVRKVRGEYRMVLMVIDFLPDPTILAHYLVVLAQILQRELAPMKIDLSVLESVAAFKREAWIDDVNGTALIELHVPVDQKEENVQSVFSQLLMTIMDHFSDYIEEVQLSEKKVKISL